MNLTPKQETFCLEYIKTGNASEAYRIAYDVKSKNMATINRSAKELMDNPKIAARVAELQKPAQEAAMISLTMHLNDLQRLRDKAESAEKYGPAVQAEMARGKASGLYVDRIKMDVSINLADRIKEARERAKRTHK